MERLRILICDDDAETRKHYEGLIQNHLQDGMLSVHLYESAMELLKDSDVIREAHIVLMDVCMEGMDGIHTAQLLRRMNQGIKIIFISSSPDYVFDSFCVSPLNYLLKGSVSDGEFIVFLGSVLEECRVQQGEERFTCYNVDRSVVFRVSDIVAFESFNREFVVHSLHGDYTTKTQLQKLYERYHAYGFAYANRSCIVNMRHILRIEGLDIYMSRKYRFTISFRNKQRFMQQFQEYLLGQEG